MLVLLSNFNISIHILVSIAPTEKKRKTLQRVGRCYGLQQLVSHDMG